MITRYAKSQQVHSNLRVAKVFTRRPSRGGYMRRRIRVRELTQREGLSGAVVRLFPSGGTGIIHGDDGYDVTFNEQSLVEGLGYADVDIGLRVSYGMFFATGAKVPTAINVTEDRESVTSAVVAPRGVTTAGISGAL